MKVVKKLATNKEAKIKFTAETSEFSKNITGINKTLGNLKSDLKLVDTEIRANGASFENLSSKQQTLRTMTEQLNQKLENQARVLESAKQNFGENSDACNKAYRAYQATQGELIRLEAQLRGVDTQLEGMTQEMSKSATETQQAESALEKLESTIKGQKDELDQLKKAYQNVVLEQGKSSTEAQQLASKITALSADLNKSETELKDVKDATDKLDQSFQDAEQGASTFGDVILAFTRGIRMFITSSLIFAICAASAASCASVPASVGCIKSSCCVDTTIVSMRTGWLLSSYSTVTWLLESGRR